MVIGLKDLKRLIGIFIVATCACFVCYLFLSYRLDLLALEGTLKDVQQQIMWEAQVLTSEITCYVTGGSLSLSAVVLLVFCVKSTVDAHRKEFGILKALGYSDQELAVGFAVFGGVVGIGCLLGVSGALIYLPNVFYKTFDGLPIEPSFHGVLLLLLVGVPTLVYALLSVGMAYRTLKKPALSLVRGTRKGSREKKGFLSELIRSTVKSRKSLAFFVAFSSFCFSAMVQMSLSMEELSSKDMALMILLIGLVLAFMSLFLSLSELVKGNEKSLALLKVFGYTEGERCTCVFGGYLPFSLLGFAVGTVYQWGLLKSILTYVFQDYENIPDYSFQTPEFFLTLAAFVVIYGAILFFYLKKVKNSSLKVIMEES